MKKTSKIKIVQNYARALFNAALDAQNMDKIQKDLENLNCIDTLSSVESPLLNQTQQNELIRFITQKVQIQQTTSNFLHLLAQNKNLYLLNDITKEFYHLVLKHRNVAQVLVETAQPLSKKQEDKLLKGLQKKLKQEVVLSYKLNQNILGGLILTMGSLQIDDSLAHKIKILTNIMKG